MDQEAGTGGTTVSGSGDPEQIRQEIDETRQQLGDTVEALAEKTDVKKQARRKLDETKVTAATKKDQLLGKANELSPDGARTAAIQAAETARRNPVALVAAGGFVAGLVVGRIGSRRQADDGN